MQYAMPFLNFLLSWCCLTHFCKWKKNILVTEQNPDSKSCYLVHNEHQPTALIWPLVDDSCRLPRIPLLVESLWRVFFLGACPGNDKIYCNQLANNSITLVWGGYVFSSFAAASPVAKTVASSVQTLWATSQIFGTKTRDKEYIVLGKCTGWPFHDLDWRSRLGQR